MKRIVSTEAKADLDRIGAYIAEDNARRSISFLVELRERIRDVFRGPQLFARIPGHEETAIRRAVHGRYTIFFRIDDHSITILRVLPSAMDFETIPFDDQ